MKRDEYFVIDSEYNLHIVPERECCDCCGSLEMAGAQDGTMCPRCNWEQNYQALVEPDKPTDKDCVSSSLNYRRAVEFLLKGDRERYTLLYELTAFENVIDDKKDVYLYWRALHPELAKVFDMRNFKELPDIKEKLHEFKKKIDTMNLEDMDKNSENSSENHLTTGSKLGRMKLENTTEADGGKGSGNFGHKGREGEVGGSAPGVSFVSASPQQFHTSLSAAKESNPPSERWRVDIHELDDYKNDKLYLTSEGSCVAVEPEGNIISVCKNQSDKTTRGRDLLRKAIANGGDRLDAFGNGLYNFYTRNGFEPVSWTKFNDDYAPEGWKPEYGREPVIFYKYTGKRTSESYSEFISRVKPHDDYDAAMEYRNEEMKK